MRILRIRGKNIASLAAPFDVDLERGPIQQAGLFAITGPTGAGKSSLLDAMCLALFDKTPRLRANKGVPVGRADEDAERLQSNDVRGLLTRGAAEGEAEVHFLGIDGERYCARWSIRRARKEADGRLQKAELSLSRLDTGEALSESRKTDTLRLIEGLLGLDFDQFRRSVFLAQGAFAEFLHADAKERGAVLERMTGTDIYAQVSMAAFARAKTERESLRALVGQQAVLEVLDDEARGVLDAELTLATERVEGLAETDRALQQERAWHVQADALRRSEAEALKELRELSSAWPQDELVGPLPPAPEVAPAEPPGEAHATNDVARALVEAFAEFYERASKRLDAAKALDLRTSQARDGLRAHQEAVSAAEAAVRARLAESTAAHEALNALDTAAAEAGAWLAKHRDAGAWAEEWSLNERDLGVASEALRRQGELAQRVEAVTRDLPQAAERRAQAVAREKHAVLALNELKAALAEAQAAFSVDDLSGRRARREEGRDALACLAGLVSAMQRYAHLHQQAREQEQQAETEGAALAVAREGAKAAEVTLAAHERTLQQMQATLSLEARRAELREGEACPLCGATEHPYVEESPAVDALMKTASLAVTEARRHKTTLERQIAGHEARASAAAAQGERLALELAEVAAGLGDSLETWRGLRGDEALVASGWAQSLASALEAVLEAVKGARATTRDADSGGVGKDAHSASEARAARAQVVSAERLAAVEAERESLTRENARRDAEIQALNALAKRAETLRARVDAAQLALDAAREELQVATKAAEALEQENTRHAELGARLAGELASAVGSLAGRLEAASLSTVSLSTVSLSTASLSTVSHSTASLAGASAEERQASPVVPGVEARVARLHDQLKRDAGAFFEERRAAVRGWSERREQQSQARQARPEKQAAADKATLLLEQARERHRVASDALSTHQGALQRDEAERAAFFGGATVQQVQAALSALQACVVRIGERSQKRLTHAQARLHTRGLEELGAAEAALAAEQEVAKRAHAELQVAQGVDDSNRKKRAELGPAIERQRAEADRWERLNGLIGQADGARFRDFAQGLTLRIVIEHANQKLMELRPRYRLAAVPGHNLDMQVIDTDMGDEVRSISSLSGGETFLVSLALALGLAESVGSSSPVDSLFIDEGFGALDGDSLEVALSTLDALQASGRVVGLISHVESIAERVGVQVKVQPVGGGRSRVRVVTMAE